MIRSAGVSQSDPGIARACAQFAEQITPILPMDGMAIVLLDPDRDTSRVVYSWTNESVSWTSLTEAANLPLLQWQTERHAKTARPALRISLNGEEGLLGEVLIRGCGPGVYKSPRRELAGQFADHLALALENIRLRGRLNNERQLSRAVESITQSASPGVSLNQVFRHFAKVIKDLVEFHRLSVYLVSEEADLAICAFRTGNGVGDRTADSTRLSNSGLGDTAASKGSQIVHDLSEETGPSVWDHRQPSAMRSALFTPVLHDGVTVGVVYLEHRLPSAYGDIDQTLLEQLVEALAPSMARLATPNRLNDIPPHTIQNDVETELNSIFGRSLLLEEIFPPLVAALAKMIPVNRAAISWIDPNGYDIRNLCASPGDGSLEPKTTPPSGSFIETKLFFKGDSIGVLTICRDQGKGFSSHEQGLLNQLGNRISPVVQADRLYIHARRQTYRLQQLSRFEDSPAQVESLTSLTTVLADQAAGIGQADWSAFCRFELQAPGLPGAFDGIIHQDELPEDLTDPVSEMAAECIAEGAPLRRSLPRKPSDSDIGHRGRDDLHRESSQDETWRCLFLPMQSSLETTGVLVLGRSGDIPWSEEEVGLLEAFVGEAANEIESARRQDAGHRMGSGSGDRRAKPVHHELLEDIAHSLRGLLASIKGISSTMQRRDIGWTEDMTREFLQIIERESDRLDLAVSDLLAPAQKELGAIELFRETVVIEDLFDLFRKSGAKYGFGEGRPSAVFVYEPTLPKVLVDPHRMTQVVYHLVAEAEAEAEAEAAFPGSHSANVNAVWRQGLPSVSISLADVEVPTSGDMLSGQETSLRLEVCRSLLAAHGTRLEKLNPGLGNEVFRFYLPIAPE